MPRVSEIEDDGGNAELAEMFKREREVFGEPAEHHQGHGALPADSARWPVWRQRRHRAIGDQLPKGLSALVSLLRAASINGCPF